MVSFREIRGSATLLVPGLLQTEDYARAVIGAALVTDRRRSRGGPPPAWNASSAYRVRTPLSCGA
ncbi:hypothetical protein GCM10023074_47500 [Microbispora amethystogenes]|uniref:DUF5753 domain-containing protein n=1 Tax=Microbispora amethystogenes TaxID=1427754 RepID=A0ABQ4FG29_9ACTN|nr:Scr1 family TA system antitoxin-like transcriptional regulator [Microbispora amethystogenes]GIH33763.1 hypothetical protein Mam01_39270 [Microbispora amethystogenes]